MNVIKRLALGLAAKWNTLRSSYRLTRLRVDTPLHSRPAAAVLRDLHATPIHSSPLTDEDQQLCASIRRETELHNRNNVTRTMAYLRVYTRHPELHWALLAHLVSRNGGWSMTDLKGSWLSQLLKPPLAEDIFGMLEACNSLIFSDAYPQLLLYAESKRRGVSLARLLPGFGVSSFMRPFWEQFFLDQSPAPLTSALIVNEQHVIQRPIVDSRYYTTHVISTPAYHSQRWLQTNQIVFPLANPSAASHSPLRLAGQVLESFANLSERIRFGQTLYAMLFGYPIIHARAVAFAVRTPHTGSRADYWPHRYRRQEQEGGMSIGQAASRIYSPSLADAWPDQPIPQRLLEDWFSYSNPFEYLRELKLPHIVDITHEHLLGQSKLEAAALALTSFKNGESSLRTGRG